MKEIDIENQFINKLRDLNYIYRPDIRDRNALEQNFKQKFEALNHVQLSPNEFSRLLDQIITPDVYNASRMLRERNSFERDDGTPLHYTLVNIKEWCKNSFEVINQLRINTYNSYHRYDVILLINGLPLVQVELKTLAITPSRAMRQIVDYKNDPGNGYNNSLLCFMQLFIVSNRNDTWYFANNNGRHFSFNVEERFLPLYQFATPDNRKVTHLDSFAELFLAKCHLAEMINRYMVLVASEQKLMMMRPYQIYAVQAIVDCIDHNNGHGYIWHTTGSGKTLTSFKAATLLKDNPAIEKCLFVVDRKDLDRQTREEFNRFQEGSVEENTNTETLVQRLLSTDYADKVIVTTIQKLGLALDDTGKRNYKERLRPLADKRVVFIFDECHRSQFGENHKAIKAFFPKAQLFGFTGTPIFAQNAAYQQAAGQEGSHRTTDDLFQHCLHAYTITHAIEDGNVLRFHVDYYKPEGKNPPKPGEPLPKEAVVDSILAKHDAATANRSFNAILATASINDAIDYYQLFQTMQSEKQSLALHQRPLQIACVFSPPAQPGQESSHSRNVADVRQLQEDLPQERQDNLQDPEGKKAALQTIIADYNGRYGTNHTINEFDLYYQDVQKRIKDQQYSHKDLPYQQKIDITIVVDMLLTGFDSKYLNTLYVDKNLKYHGLIQAFSRTNRVLNDTKPYGNILDFRQQEAEVNQAITLFSGQSHLAPKEIWLVPPATSVIDKLQTAVARLHTFMQEQQLPPTPDAVLNLRGDLARIQFVQLFKEVQRCKVQIDQYTDLSPDQKGQIDAIIPEEQLQGFRGVYLSTAERLRGQQGQADNPEQPELSQLDFELVLFASALIDYDYIMRLVARTTEQSPAQQRASREQLVNMIRGDAKFEDDRDELIEYIDQLPTDRPFTEQTIREGYNEYKVSKVTAELAAIAQEHGLETAVLQTFFQATLQRYIFDSEQLRELLVPLGLGWKARKQKEEALVAQLRPLWQKQAPSREISGLEAYE